MLDEIQKITYDEGREIARQLEITIDFQASQGESRSERGSPVGKVKFADEEFSFYFNENNVAIIDLAFNDLIKTVYAGPGVSAIYNHVKTMIIEKKSTVKQSLF
ncbi:MAG: hypothetical protein WAX04_02220 [Oscillospiraceae bacterium]